MYGLGQHFFARTGFAQQQDRDVAPGAYTGAAQRQRDGKFQLANGGTLFLDEVGDMPLPLQAKLLRVLQEGEVEPLGSNKVQPLNVRVIAATSRNLGEMMEEGRFRSDLYYRLNVLEIPIPPLRDRLQDLGVLCEALLENLGRDLELRAEITDAAIGALSGYCWPGNIRELRNVLERILTLREDSGVIDANDIASVLPVADLYPPSAAGGSLPKAARPLAEVLAEAERGVIATALATAGGNRSKAARILGISRSALYAKLGRLS